ncbi:MAG: O-antigen ligase family protein [Cyclobacteriaceae bacterium]|nr:O-antigen ligase family protein [Cyclobacteriaceae bacterium]
MTEYSVPKMLKRFNKIDVGNQKHSSHVVIDWLWALFVLTIPSFHYLNVRILVGLLIISLFVVSTKKISLFLLQSWDLLLYAAVLLIGFTYSADRSEALRVLETNFSIIALPIVYAFLLHKEQDRYLLNLFTVGVLISGLISLIVSIIKYNNGLDLQVFFFYEFSEFVGSQPTYFAYYIIFAMIWITYQAYFENFNYSLWIYSLIMSFLFGVLTLTSGKTAFIAILISFSFFALKFLQGNKSKHETHVMISMIVLLLVFVYVSGSNQIAVLLSNPSDNWDRSVIWKAAVNANPNPILGVGIGDYKEVLNKYFLSQGMNEFAKESLNAHNQYIHSFFSNGILGLAILSLVLIRPLYLSFKMQFTLGILLAFPFVIYAMTEVILGRYQGIVFFVFCHQLVISSCLSSRIKLEFDSHPK